MIDQPGLNTIHAADTWYVILHWHKSPWRLPKHADRWHGWNNGIINIYIRSSSPEIKTSELWISWLGEMTRKTRETTESREETGKEELLERVIIIINMRRNKFSRCLVRSVRGWVGCLQFASLNSSALRDVFVRVEAVRERSKNCLIFSRISLSVLLFHLELTASFGTFWNKSGIISLTSRIHLFWRSK